MSTRNAESGSLEDLLPPWTRVLVRGCLSLVGMHCCSANRRVRPPTGLELALNPQPRDSVRPNLRACPLPTDWPIRTKHAGRWYRLGLVPVSDVTETLLRYFAFFVLLCFLYLSRWPPVVVTVLFTALLTERSSRE
ncbi:unnamed protein product [Protopolystoma xenopodis]|uniref:Uncharacterized protein n=1 Tax=Protopolystoma xenopodis TaxID=117903 RepID=A0A3S4ZHX8_9PLAT|nr:unnamed protein product [Protopolystoma xenopodis]